MGDEDIPDLTDIGIPSATGAGALALYFLVGPSLKAVGNAFGEWTEYRMRNLLRIDEKTQVRLSRLKTQPAQPSIHPRLAKNLVDDASWIDDELQQDYYAGVLFSAIATETTEEAAYFARIVSALTPSQLRLHYALYRSYRGSYESTAALNFTRGGDLAALAVRAPINSFRSACRSPDDMASARGMGVATGGLAREGLIGRMGWIDRDEKVYSIEPTLMGASLFSLAMGYPAGIDIRRSEEYLRQEVPRFALPVDERMPGIAGAQIG
ncbi:hypothetical protein MT344_08190 [Clavibacter michiganensis subsp. phaseoli]|uniref:hypothetical protein n=1 Tax=Clavibacter phaseoli TaxID=1734031 RepID=UPI001FB2D56E|nr:hypothetical protein [Clavibacter phaseoli]MCJ1711156.1 hypothetical protein [Clavibacter phaseoli]